MDVRNEMLELLTGRDPNFSLEQKFYTDPDYYKLDLKIFSTRTGYSSAMIANCPRPAPT